MSSPSNQDLLHIIAAQNQTMKRLEDKITLLEQAQHISMQKTTELVSKINEYESTVLLFSDFSTKQLNQQQQFMSNTLDRLSSLEQQVTCLPTQSPNERIDNNVITAPTTTTTTTTTTTASLSSPTTDLPSQSNISLKESSMTDTSTITSPTLSTTFLSSHSLPNSPSQLIDFIQTQLHQKGYDEKFFPAIFKWLEHLYLNHSQSVHYINQHSSTVRTEFKRVEDWLMYIESQVHIIYETVSAITNKGRNIKKTPYISYLKWLELRKVLPHEFSTYPTSDTVVPDSYKQHLTPAQQQVHEITSQLQAFQLYMYNQKVQDAENTQAQQLSAQKQRQLQLTEQMNLKQNSYTTRRDQVLQLNTSLPSTELEERIRQLAKSTGREFGDILQQPIYNGQNRIGNASNSSNISSNLPSMVEMAGLQQELFHEIQKQQLEALISPPHLNNSFLNTDSTLSQSTHQQSTPQMNDEMQ